MYIHPFWLFSTKNLHIKYLIPTLDRCRIKGGDMSNGRREKERKGNEKKNSRWGRVCEGVRGWAQIVWVMLIRCRAASIDRSRKAMAVWSLNRVVATGTKWVEAFRQSHSSIQVYSTYTPIKRMLHDTKMITLENTYEYKSMVLALGHIAQI